MKGSGGQWVDSEEDVRWKFLSFFLARWMASLKETDFLLPPSVSQVTDSKSTQLMADVSSEEIRQPYGQWLEIKRLDPFFLRWYWAIIHHELVDVIQEFFITESMPETG